MAGNINHYCGGVSDVERSRRELALIDSMLALLPHGVRYKTYPARDVYADPDPVLAALARHPCIDLFDEDTDLRYMIRRHRVVVTARATSTIGWCIMADRPVVFINHPDHAPLRPAVREVFDSGLFLFDWQGETTLDRLRAFLSRPLAEIEDDWHARRAARAILRRDLVCGPEGLAGRRARDLILPLIDGMPQP